MPTQSAMIAAGAYSMGATVFMKTTQRVQVECQVGAESLAQTGSGGGQARVSHTLMQPWFSWELFACSSMACVAEFGGIIIAAPL